MTPREMQRALRDRTTYLRRLSRHVSEFIDWMDQEMAKPSSPERVARIAQACNALDLSNQLTRRFGLPSRRQAVAKDGRRTVRGSDPKARGAGKTKRTTRSTPVTPSGRGAR